VRLLTNPSVGFFANIDVMVGDGKTNQLFERGLAQSFCMSSLGTNNGEGASQGMEITQPSSPKNWSRFQSSRLSGNQFLLKWEGQNITDLVFYKLRIITGISSRLDLKSRNS